MVRVLGGLAVAVLFWVLGWQPLVRDIAGLERARAREAQALTSARSDVQQMSRLAQTPIPAPVDARAAVERSLVRMGLRSAVTQLEWRESRAFITFAAVSFPLLVTWLDDLQRETGVRPIEATLSARVEPGVIRAELVLAQ